MRKNHKVTLAQFIIKFMNKNTNKNFMFILFRKGNSILLRKIKSGSNSQKYLLDQKQAYQYQVLTSNGIKDKSYFRYGQKEQRKSQFLMMNQSPEVNFQFTLILYAHIRILQQLKLYSRIIHTKSPMKKQLNKAQAEQLFRKTKKQAHQLIGIPKRFEQTQKYCKHSIQKHIKGFSFFSICQREYINYESLPYFQRAFETLSLSEKVIFYSKFIHHLKQVLLRSDPFSENQCQNQFKEKQSCNLFFLNGSSWELTRVEIVNFELYSKPNFHIYLNDYILRRSKRKDRECFVLEACMPIDPETFRFSFVSKQDEKKYCTLIKSIIDKAELNWIRLKVKQYNKLKLFIDKKILKRNDCGSQSLQKQQRMKENKYQTQECKQQERKEQIKSNPEIQNLFKSFENSLMIQAKPRKRQGNEKLKISESISEEIFQRPVNAPQVVAKETFKHKNEVFRRLLSEYSLKQLPQFDKFNLVYEQKSLKSLQLSIYQSTSQTDEFKLSLLTNISPELLINGISDANKFCLWHPEVISSRIQMRIQSENSCIQYQEHNPYTKWYHPRCFKYLAYLFRKDDEYYLINRSVDQESFPLEKKKVRGQFEKMLCRIAKIKDGSHLIIEIRINHGQYLKKKQKQQLTLRFLKGFSYLPLFLSSEENISSLSKGFNLSWEIEERKESFYLQQQKKSFISRDFMSYNSETIESMIDFYTIDQQSSESEVEQIEIENLITFQNNEMLMTESKVVKLNSKGQIIIPPDYLTRKHSQKIKNSEYDPVCIEYKNLMLKHDWQIISKGGLKLINKEKIEAQDSVFRFIMRTLKNNLFSGRSILHISLPVDIFNTDSYLQRTCLGLGLAPTFLERAAMESDPVERFKYCMAYGYTFSVLCFDVQKPFNPILGETYQGYIRGCPVYAEQISHHPPISSYLMVGRGYKAHGSIQAVAKIHLNSGQGINNGWNVIQFDDGGRVMFQTPPGELYGLTVGYRGFRIKGKGIYVDESNHLFLEMNFDEGWNIFKKRKWQYNDQIEGQLLRVTSKFLKNIIKTKSFVSPLKKDIEESYFKISGRWAQGLFVDGELIYDVQKHLPDKLIDQPYPLHSNSKYRADLLYRKKGDNKQSQIEKQILQNRQREDRKLRQKSIKH